ncbi:VOC family protein [Amaricoccus solimangrovi]|uniref:VOC family protein n=1 Tax=Amaricoccus solimangrovi TaxID=2589815 RepID=A0A501WVT4_9RHOB|nr:VOC family protein [Amaricoccus solimangrovi]TPE52530.1 VOC family protein [Amaricoccus solimangrovi]
MATSDAPIEIGHVALTVHDLGKLSGFYQRSVGLDLLGSDSETARLGAGGRMLVELRRDAAARFRSPREAGLFHTAFLLPDRADLGALLDAYAERGARLQGASDHAVSEALYLSDPEGNGIEIYVDRPREAWPRGAGGIGMTTEPLDIADLRRAATGRWTGAPAGTVVGHVHLQVGAIPEAEVFYTGPLGMSLVTRYPGASFFATGGYHHHLATNVWNSRHAGPRDYPATGLAEVALRAEDAEYERLAAQAGGEGLRDPWNTRFSVAPKAA